MVKNLFHRRHGGADASAAMARAPRAASTGRTRIFAIATLVSVASGVAGVMAATAARVGLPEIRTSERNRVPACATPERLTAFLRSRNGNLDGRYRDIARHYQTHGEAWRVRWDYAFYQMLIETNFLTYRTPGGGMGDVNPRQNNFAGIGATGGVPGDSFPNVSTGVLAQVQHLVAYSGERLSDPTAPRTRLKMDEILTKSKDLGRPVTFQDLAGRWAVDKAYGRSIEWVAQSFRTSHCQGQPEVAGDSKPTRQRLSAHWPRPTRAATTRLADSDSGERAMRSNLGREGNRNRDDDRDDDDKDKRAASKPAPKSASPTGPKRPLQRPVITGSVETPETTERRTTQRVLPSAPPPIIKPKPPTSASPAGSSDKAAGAGSASTTTAAAAVPAKSPALPTTASPPVAGTATPTAGVSGPGAAAASPPSALPTAAPSGVATAPAAGAPARPSNPCKIFRASYGGPKTVLIQSQKEAVTNYTVLEVTAGREQEQAKAFMEAHARGGKVIGEFPAEADALKKSFELCPGG